MPDASHRWRWVLTAVGFIGIILGAGALAIGLAGANTSAQNAHVMAENAHTIADLAANQAQQAVVLSKAATLRANAATIRADAAIHDLCGFLAKIRALPQNPDADHDPARPQLTRDAQRLWVSYGCR